MEELVRPVEVFVSYAHKDEILKDLLLQSLRALEDEGLVRLWQDRKIRAGKEWEGEIGERLKSAGLILLLVSPDFLASEYCRDIENKLAQEQAEKEHARIIPVILRPCEWQRTPLGQFQALPQSGKPVSEWEDQGAVFCGVVAGIRASAEEVREELFGARLPPIWNVPFHRNPHFTGRRELLRDLRAALASGRAAALTQALHGLGGVGKTQLALEYAYRYGREYRAVWWVRSEEPSTLAGDYAGLAAALDLPGKNDPDQGKAVAAVRRWLVQNPDWLIILDNATGPAEVKDYLPQATTGHIIITSRNPNWSGLAESLTVETLSRNESVGFLLRSAGLDDRQSAGELSEELGDLPLALAQAAAYIEETGSTVDHYVDLFRASRKRLLEKKPPSSGYPTSVAATWELSFVRLEQESPAAAELLNLCAFFAPDNIPLELLPEGRDRLPKILADAVAEAVAYDEVKAAIRRYSLAAVSGANLTVHRLVQAVAWDRLPARTAKRWASIAVRLMSVLFPDCAADSDYWPRCERLLPHALKSAEHARPFESASEAVARVWCGAARYYQGRAQYARAESLLEMSLALREKALDPSHPDLVRTLRYLGDLSREEGKYADAERLLRRALEASETRAPDREQAECLHDLAVLYWELPRHGEAEAFCRRALPLLSDVLGPEDPNVGLALNLLGMICRDQGELAEAEQHMRRSVEILEKEKGVESPKLATSLNNLAMICNDQGKVDEAVPLFQRALAIQEKALGPEHPSFGDSLNNLGYVYYQQGRYSETEALYKRALEVRRSAYGPDHPRVAASFNNLAKLYQKMGRYDDAERLYGLAFDAFKKALGEENPVVAKVLRNMADLYRAMGNATKACELDSQAKRITAEE